MARAITTLSPPCLISNFPPLPSLSSLPPPSTLSFHSHTLQTTPRLSIRRSQLDGSAGEDADNEIGRSFFDDDVILDDFSDDDDGDDTESSIDLFIRFLQAMFKKLSKRAKKASRSVLPTAISSQLEALSLLKRCSSFNQLKLIHARIIRHSLTNDQSLLRNLIDLCSGYGKMDYATLIFHQIHTPEVFTWNLMIRAHTTNCNTQQALHLYNLMICKGFLPDKFTFPFAIKACIVSSAIDKGKEVHGLAVKSGFSHDMFVQNTLMDLYFKCGELEYARKVFDTMRVRSVVSWTTMITGLAACGDLDAAREIFEQMPTKNVVSWTTMINSYVRDNRPEDAFELFQRMQLDNVKPNEFTLVSLLQACTQVESLKLGSWIHEFALKIGLEVGGFLGTALVDMYSKCGSLKNAWEVFDKMQVKNLATWNSMITSLGVHGHGEEALNLFEQMEKANIQPDAITFVGVLCACVHTNNVNEGCRYFHYMTQCYGIKPILEHYICMIQLFHRADMKDEVCDVLDSMPEKLDEKTLAALLLPSVNNSVDVVDVEGILHQSAEEKVA